MNVARGNAPSIKVHGTRGAPPGVRGVASYASRSAPARARDQSIYTELPPRADGASWEKIDNYAGLGRRVLRRRTFP